MSIGKAVVVDTLLNMEEIGRHIHFPLIPQMDDVEFSVGYYECQHFQLCLPLDHIQQSIDLGIDTEIQQDRDVRRFDDKENKVTHAGDNTVIFDGINASSKRFKSIIGRITLTYSHRALTGPPDGL